MNVQSLIADEVRLWELPGEQLCQLAEAGRMFTDCRRCLRSKGHTIIGEVAGASVEESTHYPPGDVYDWQTHAQYYFHWHRQGEFGHFHVFLRPLGMPGGLLPVDPQCRDPDGGNTALAHLVAIGLDRSGEPAELFATNRWVTAETWYRAADICAMLPRFKITHDQPSILANQWITSLVALFRPQIEKVLIERDARIMRDHPSVPPASFLDDPNIEVLSRMSIAVDEQIDQIERALAALTR